MDEKLLIKLLNLSVSSNDSEALSAMRKANDLLKENKLTWEKYFTKKYSELKQMGVLYSIEHMNLLKEQAYSKDIEERLSFSTMIVKYMIIFVLLLVASLLIVILL